MKILSLHQDRAMYGNSAYRYVIPYTEIGRNNHIAEWSHLEDFEKIARGTNLDFTIYDIVSVQRLFFRRKNFPKMHKFVHDVDDDVLHKQRKLFKDVKERTNYEETLRRVDAVTVSTQYLKKLMERKFNKPTFVCPNAMDIRTFDAIELPKNKPPIFGLTGGPTHYKDWKVAGKILPDIMKDNPEWILYIVGFVPDYLENLEKQFPNRVVNIDFFLPYPAYTRILKLIDVRLSPLDVDDTFNYSKSAIASMEMMACSNVSIAQQINVYEEVVRSGYNGFLCNSENDWFNTTQKVLKDRLLRKQIGKNGREFILKNHDIRVLVHEWIKSYEDIMRL